MQLENWQRVEEIFHRSIALDSNDREAYLSEVCEGNEDLRREVTSLIDAFESNPKILSESAYALSLEILDKEQPALPNNGEIGNYKILCKLGSGGMGDVFLADDTKLNRKVALKFLANYFTDDNWAKRRLVREAQAAAILDHPNICPIYGLEAVDEHLFIVMQYVEGTTLTEVMKERRIAGIEAFSIITQISEAIAAAHASGIIHRDIKPGNIIVGPEGRVKVLDFGLAKRVENVHPLAGETDNASEVSQMGLILGTVAYMSPEQLRAEELDYRSDIFSFGILVYELISGLHPFAQPSEAETISSILVTNPAELDLRNLQISPDLNKVLTTCLQKRKEQRYIDGNALLQAVLSVSERGSTVLRWPIQYVMRVAAVLALLVLFVSAAFFFSKPKAQSLAVLPFVNNSGDAEVDFLADGLAEDLISQLSRRSQLKIKPYTTILGYRGVSVDPLNAARELGVDTVLFGIVIRQGDQYILQTSLTDVKNARLISTKEKSIDQSRILELRNELTETILEDLQPWWGKWRMEPTNQKTLGQPNNSAAFKLYLLGRHYWKKRDEANIKLAIDSFQQAINLDPTFAPAHAGLADSYVLLSSVAYGSVPTKEVMTKARAAARQAIEIDPRLCDSHSALAVVLMKYDWNWPKAEEEFRKAIELNPDYAPAHYWLSGLLAITGRSSESIAEAETAKMLDPFSSLSDLNLARAYYYARRYDDSLAVLRSGTNGDPSEVKSRYMVGLIFIQRKLYKDAIDILRPIYDANKLMGGAALGFAYAQSGNRQAALDVLSELEKIGVTNHLPPQEKAILYIGLNDRDRAFLYLNEAYQERYAPLISLAVEPLYDGLYSDPRYLDLLAKMSLNAQN